jgi:hypothetical protein
MVEAAKVLSSNFAHVRVDFYYLFGHVYFGELTFFDASGFNKFSPAITDTIWGEWININVAN